MGDRSPCVNLGLVFSKAKAYLAIVSLQFGFAGMYIITKVSLNHGMSNYVLVVYRHLAATAAIAPFALILERKIRPKLTLPIFLRILVLGFLEPVIDQNLYVLGMKYTSASFAAATVNVLPAITFIMAVICRLERVNIKKLHSQAKVIGTIVTVSGAMIMTFYKGPIVDFLRSRGGSHHGAMTDSSDQHWLLGTLLLLLSACGWAGFFIVQSFTLKLYPAELSLTALICFTGIFEGGAVALVMERDPSAWVVGWDSRLLAAVYSGIVCSGIAYYIQGVLNKERGPVFITTFNPLCMIITAALGAIILAETIHLGSIIGATVIVLGLYTVVWGKRKDHTASSTSLIEDEKAGTQELPIVNPTRHSGNDLTGLTGVAKVPMTTPILQD